MNFKEYKIIVHAPKKEKMRGDRIYNLERNISSRISWVLYRHAKWVKPNYISFISIAILVLAFYFNFIKNISNAVVLTLAQLIILYLITITDRVDGELARAKDMRTQKGMYLDRTVHFFYPFIFYFSIANFFLVKTGNMNMFHMTLLLGVLTINLVMFGEAKTFILEKLKLDNFSIKDFIPKDKDTKYKRRNIIFRGLDYLTFMIYAWILFYYILVIFISNYNFQLAWNLYLFQVILAMVVVLYRIFYSLPDNKLFKESIKN